LRNSRVARKKIDEVLVGTGKEKSGKGSGEESTEEKD